MDINEFKIEYMKKLNSLGTSGFSLATRIISTISLHRGYDSHIFTNKDPNIYIKEIFEKQFVYLDYAYEMVKILNIQDSGSSLDGSGNELNSNDSLHINLFNSTWKTLKIKNDPSNDYQKWINIIKSRLELNKLDKNFFNNKNCLDVGCGTGRFSFCMSNLGANVWGIDPGEDSIAEATSLAKKMGLEKITFLKQNAYELKFNDNFFDFVTCNGVLHHLDKPKAALKEIFRVLKKGGKFWLYVEGSGGIYHDMWDLVYSSFEDVPYQRTLEMCNLLNISDLHFWMDRFYAKYNLISFKENEERLKDIGFTEINRMKSSELFDMDIKMFNDDDSAKFKFGDGGIRILATK